MREVAKGGKLHSFRFLNGGRKKSGIIFGWCLYFGKAKANIGLRPDSRDAALW